MAALAQNHHSTCAWYTGHSTAWQMLCASAQEHCRMMHCVASYSSRSCHACKACTPRGSTWVTSPQTPFGSLLTGQSCSHCHDLLRSLLGVGFIVRITHVGVHCFISPLAKQADVCCPPSLFQARVFWSTRLVLPGIATHTAMASSALCSSNIQ